VGEEVLLALPDDYCAQFSLPDDYCAQFSYQPPMTFTPTSVIRKMHSDRVSEKEKQGRENDEEGTGMVWFSFLG
jgi:hypothetical protein